MSYTVCRAETHEFMTHCNTIPGLQQCEYCEWYQQGHGEPHYPVPAIRITGEYVVDGFDDSCYFGAFEHHHSNVMVAIGDCWKVFPPKPVKVEDELVVL